MNKPTDPSQTVLDYFVTNTDSNVYGFRNLPQVVMGAIFAAYSRSPLTAREILKTKFLGDDEFSRLYADLTKIKDRAVVVNPEKAEAFYNRVLVQYGDDSVAELGTAHMAIEGVSNVVVKLIEDRRIGLNPLEKSSRYVYFNQKNAFGEYNYYRDPKIMKSRYAKLYIEAMDRLFDTYTELLEPLKSYFSERYPRQADQTETAYNAALRAQACDILRYLLPMATLTNMGAVGNGRTWEYLIQNLLASPLAEAQDTGKKLLRELQQTLPAFVRRVETEVGQKAVDYLVKRHKYLGELPQADQALVGDGRPGVRLVDYDKDGETRVAAALLLEASNQPLDGVRSRLSMETKDYVREIIRGIYPLRGHRTHKPPRAFEHTTYTFDILCDIGAFRDLHRHRVLTQQRQMYTTDHGYVVPQEIEAIGATDRYRQAMDGAREIYEKLRRALPDESQYAVPFGYLVRWTVKLNAREAFHLCELRSTPQGHWSYRFVAQEMAKRIAAVHPAIGGGMLVDWEENAEMTRIRAEQRQEQKLAALGLERDYV